LFDGGWDGGGGLRGGGGRGLFDADRGAGGRRLEEGGGRRECCTMVVTVDMPLDGTWDTAWERTIETLA